MRIGPLVGLKLYGNYPKNSLQQPVILCYAASYLFYFKLLYLLFTHSECGWCFLQYLPRSSFFSKGSAACVFQTKYKFQVEN